MTTGPISSGTSRDNVRWRPIGSWEQGGSWAYRTRRDWGQLYGPAMVAFWVAEIQLTGGSIQVTRSTVAAAVLWSLFLWFQAALVRTGAEVDGRGITVINGWRTHRVRWGDVDVVQLDGRPASTLLTKDRRITCWSLRQGLGDLLPWSRLERRQALEETASWIRDMAATDRLTIEQTPDYRTD